MSNLGEQFKIEREAQGLTLADVEDKLHIRQHLLEALEANNFKVFPSPVVARGLIRNYATYLGLDPIEALTLYDGNGRIPVKGQRLTSDGIEFMNLSMAPRPRITWDSIIGVILFLLVVGGAGFFIYEEFIQPGTIVTPTAQPVSAADNSNGDSALILPTVTPPPTNTPTPIPPTDTPTPIIYTGVTVELLIEESSWVQILVDGVKDFEGELTPGDNRSWTGQQRVAIRAGNAGGVAVVVNGTNRGVMGANGQVVDQVWEKVGAPPQTTPESTLPTETPTPSP
ncbi:MAG: RodZ domain-containing protein [Chloroflexota bacterium]